MTSVDRLAKEREGKSKKNIRFGASYAKDFWRNVFGGSQLSRLVMGPIGRVTTVSTEMLANKRWAARQDP